MSKCTNPKVGNLIHAYELKTLRNDDAEQFELHILDCDYCFNELSSFHDEASILLTADRLKKAVEDELSTKTSKTPVKNLGWRSLWPGRTPFILKPAVGYGLAALLVIAWLGNSMLTESEKIREVQSIGFYQSRSNESGAFYKNRSSDAVINFIVPEYHTQLIIVVNIYDPESRLIYANDRFSGIDVNGLGRLYLSLDDLKTGEYTLEIKIPENNPPLDRIIYSFEIN